MQQTERINKQFNILIFYRFKVENILSKPSPNWKHKTGHISKQILEETIANHLETTGHKREDIFVTVCGPTLFTNLTEKLLYEVGIRKEQLHLFQG